MVIRQSWIKQLVQNSGYKSFMKRLLISAAIVTVAGLAGQYLLHVQSMLHLVIIGMGMLSIVFFFKAYERPTPRTETQEGSNQPAGFWASDSFANFVQKLYGWGVAVLIMGLLFLFEHWPGWQTLLICGVPTGILGIVLKVLSHKSRNSF